MKVDLKTVTALAETFVSARNRGLITEQAFNSLHGAVLEMARGFDMVQSSSGTPVADRERCNLAVSFGDELETAELSAPMPQEGAAARAKWEQRKAKFWATVGYR
jgi:hypothetical protein